MLFGKHSSIGGRDQNEDKLFVSENIDGKDTTTSPINLTFICDGHGGKEISEYLHQQIPAIFMNKSQSYPITQKKGTTICTQIQSGLENKKCALETGSTAIICAFYKTRSGLYYSILNVGDCRAVICRDNAGIPLTIDHKPNWPNEYRRITALGGKPYRDGPDYRIDGLSVSRAFGDLNQKKFVYPLPDVTSYKIHSSDKFIVFACDGIWDVASNQDIVNYILNIAYDKDYVRVLAPATVAKKIVQYAIDNKSTDNVSVVIVFFD